MASQSFASDSVGCARILRAWSNVSGLQRLLKMLANIMLHAIARKIHASRLTLCARVSSFRLLQRISLPDWGGNPQIDFYPCDND
jgi:hypothetical protein